MIHDDDIQDIIPDNLHDIFSDYFELAIDYFRKKYKVDDFSKESQNRWTALLQYINHTYIRNIELKIHGNRREYNVDVLLILLDVYIYYCNLYQKEISINGYSKLSNIAISTIYGWNNRYNNIYINNIIDNNNIIDDNNIIDSTNIIDNNSNIYNIGNNINNINNNINNNGNNNLSIKYNNIYKRLISENESSNSDMLANGKNPLGVAMRLNRYHGWNSPNTQHHEEMIENISLIETKDNFKAFLEAKNRQLDAIGEKSENGIVDVD